ncbi:TonB-dependent receptor plug domain-containing protein [Avibacterium avium]|uniref:TonB-dependent receptor plug domain-containing protein n=1 Tax=Avibacterium avium TaxID=751 RepID=UPI003BF844F8
MQKNIITTAILLSFSTALYAAENVAQSEQLAPIYVYSAYATPVIEDQTASSVTVLTEKDFAERNATYVSDVLKTVPSVALGASGGRGAITSLFLRGAESDQTAIFIDGVRVNDIGSGGFDFGGLTLSNIDRIEVLRGEQSALWGSDAMGGVVYITTKTGLHTDKPFNVDFNVGMGSKGTYDASATVSGSNKGFYYAFSGDSHSTKNISALSEHRFYYRAENGRTYQTGGATERDKFHRDGVSAKLGYDDGRQGVEVLASHSSQTVHTDPYLLSQEATADNYSRTRQDLFKLSGYYGTEQDLLKHHLTISEVKTKMDNFSSSFTANSGKRANANYQLDINFDREGDLTQGLSLLADYQKTTYGASSEAMSAPYHFSGKKLIEKSIATEYRLFHKADHSFSISGRYVDNSQYNNAFVGRISGAYRLYDNLKAHASFGNAIRNPSLIDYYGWNGRFKANPNLKPEKSVGGEFGLLLESNDKAHQLDITYFARKVEDLIQSNSNYTQSINLEGKSRIKGVEVAYNGKITNDLSAYANYTYTQTKDSKGQALVRRPKHMANLGLAYQITEALGANVNVNYVGKRFVNYPARIKMPSYTLVGLGANYQVTQNLNVYANLNNLFDKKYESVAGYGQYGRTLYVGLKGSF